MIGSSRFCRGKQNCEPCMRNGVLIVDLLAEDQVLWMIA
ncbi:MAG: hypothetical protein Q27BB25_04520 [Blastomonas sp. CACIA14H2]|nr:MAG: hypothetical protein Q27BB25_04520 [Blastomonas sp. CACIA14H2]